MSLFRSASTIAKSPHHQELYVGQSKAIDITVVDGSDIYRTDLSSVSRVVFTMRADGDRHLLQKTLQNGGIEILDPPEEGRIRINIDSIDTRHIAPGRYIFDVWVEEDDGARYPIIENSEFTLKEPATYM